MNVPKYQILVDYTVASLQRQVNDFLANGWFLQGGIAVTKSNGTSMYCQALIFPGKTTQ